MNSDEKLNRLAQELGAAQTAVTDARNHLFMAAKYARALRMDPGIPKFEAEALALTFSKIEYFAKEAGLIAPES